LREGLETVPLAREELRSELIEQLQKDVERERLRYLDAARRTVAGE
jgi:hypothetical protein